jgi:hypothetical protein
MTYQIIDYLMGNFSKVKFIRKVVMKFVKYTIVINLGQTFFLSHKVEYFKYLQIMNKI